MLYFNARNVKINREIERDERGVILSDKQKVIRMDQFHGMNIGILVFLIIIIYVFFNLFSYLTSNPVAEYEVGQGTIATNHVYRGLIIRDETVVNAGKSGYINYYLKNGSKASVNDIIFSVDTNGDLSGKITSQASDGTGLSTTDLDDVSSEIDAFRNYYDANSYASVYSFKDELSSRLGQTLGVSALNKLSYVVDDARANNTFYPVKSERPGVIVYETDGYENVSVNNFTPELLKAASYKKEALDDRKEVKSADAAYKRINSELWTVILPVSDDMVKLLKDHEYIKIRFCKDDFTLTVPFTTLKKDGGYYLNLSLKTAMIRYVHDRFADIELVVSEKTGLKIPNTAIVTKSFIKIPKKYFSSNEDSTSPSVFLIGKSGKMDDAEMIKPTIVSVDKKYYYIDDDSIQAGDVLVRKDSSETYTVGRDTGKLTGVYNINKGYTVFKQIEILSQNENYSIIEPKTDYGIALYDHIALDGSKVKDNQMVIK